MELSELLFGNGPETPATTPQEAPSIDPSPTEAPHVDPSEGNPSPDEIPQYDPSPNEAPPQHI